MISTDNSRVIEVYKHLKSTRVVRNQQDFTERVHSDKSTISQILNNKIGVPNNLFSNILSAFPQISRVWLLTGEGEMLRADQAAPSVDSTSVKSDESPHMIPFYDAETTGSFSGLVGASDTDATILGYINAGSWFDHRETAAIRHTGDSMTEYPSGCVLALRQIHEKRLLVPGRNYVIETSEYRVTKRVQLGSAPDRIALYSSNTERYPDGRLIYEPFEIELSDIRRIFSILGYIVNLSGDPRFIPT